MNNRLTSLLLFVVLAITFHARTALAQDTTSATDDDVTSNKAFVTIDLEAGYPLDPLIVSLNGGGDVDASVYGEECTGFISESPTVTLNWAGESDFVEAFFYSDHDPVLVVQTPDGAYLCNDDANALLLDPVLQIEDPEQGRYNIWVGSFDPNQLLPGVLVLTTRPEVNVGTFALDNLITRVAIPEDLVEFDEVNTGKLVTKTAASNVTPAIEWNSEEELTHTVTVSGTVPAFDISTPAMTCNGYVHTLPDFVFSLSDSPDQLRIFFEGDGDATLMVQDPEGTIFCNDDHVAGENLNPVVDIPAPVTGQYYVFIGRVQIDEEIHGVMTVSGSVELKPEVLEGDQ